MATAIKSVSSSYLLQGSVYALEQCGFLLLNAVTLYRGDSYGTAVVLAAFAREELGRSSILLDLRAKVLTGEVVTIKQIKHSCENHVTKQKRAMLSTVIKTHRDTGLGKLLETGAHADRQSEEWRRADEEIAKIDERQRRRAPDDRHVQRMRALYVEPNDTGTDWNRPRDTSKTEAYEFLEHARNDYSVRTDKFNPALLGHDKKLLQELEELAERPKFPFVNLWDG